MVTALLAVLGSASVLAGTASANPLCSGFGCDFQDPIAMHCVEDSSVVGTAIIGDGAEKGYVDLIWSPACQTNWARVTSTSGPIYSPRVMGVEIKRASDGAAEYFDTNGVFSTSFGNGTGGGSNGGPTYQGTTTLYTDMVYSPGPAAAIGTIDRASDTYSQYGYVVPGI
jgi:hypothetical protein